MIRVIVLVLLAMTGLVSAQPQSVVFESGDRQVTTIEVFSSQGCSSCPPAEQWVNLFMDDPDLWSTKIPMVFHVDYWNYLGWKDPFSDRDYSQRQRRYKRQSHANSVYTPGFMVNGYEWRGWFSKKPIPSWSKDVGNLRVEMKADEISAFYPQHDDDNRLNVAILGFDLTTHVRRGENRNRKLEQNFVVLSHWQVAGDEGIYTTAWEMPSIEAPRYAMTAWISKKDNQQPIQATGGWIPEVFF